MLSPFLVFTLLPFALAANKVSNLVVFGDSYSDVGNFQRWTNGPVWSEYASFGYDASLHSFAYSGAVCDNTLFPNNTSTYYNTPSIQDQVEFYYQQHLNLDPSETVFAFWVGVNDIHQAFKEQPVAPNFNMISDCIIEQIRTVHRVFKANQIMLINLPPMEAMPYFKDSDMATSRGEAVRLVNEGLKHQVAALNEELGTLELDLVDAHSLLSDMLREPESFGITNTDSAYWDDCQGKCKDLEMDDYVWWDRTHFTGAVHEVLGNSILSAGSYAPKTTVSKAKVERLLLASVSNIRSPIYRAQPNSGIIQQLLADVDTSSSSGSQHKDSTGDDNNDNATTASDNNDSLEEKSQDYSIRQWLPAMIVVTIIVSVGALMWIRKRRNGNNHQLLRNEYIP